MGGRPGSGTHASDGQRTVADGCWHTTALDGHTSVDWQATCRDVHWTTVEAQAIGRDGAGHVMGRLWHATCRETQATTRETWLQTTSRDCCGQVVMGTDGRGQARAIAAAASMHPKPYALFGIGSAGWSRSGRAVCRRMSPTCAAVRLALHDRMSAARPATCGDAIDVPSLVPKPLSQSVLRMPTPGATTSMCGPVCENPARWFDALIAPTAITPGYAAGKLVGLPCWNELPIAATTTAPRATA
jgi:hypothetical protein